MKRPTCLTIVHPQRAAAALPRLRELNPYAVLHSQSSDTALSSEVHRLKLTPGMYQLPNGQDLASLLVWSYCHVGSQ